MNIQSITERSMITPQGEEVILFLLQPTNVSVLSREGLRARVNALMNVLKGFAEVELLCLNSRESFEHNKQYLTRRIEQEPVPQIRALLEQDLRHLDEIQSRTATAREFMLVIRPRNIGEREIYPYLSRVEKMIREQRFAKTAELVKIPGHPLHTFTLENEALVKTIEKCREALKNGHVEYKLIEEVRQLAIHYAKKGDLLYPHLKVKYEISGPSDVMWTVDDEIRDEFAALAKKADSQDDEWKKRFEAALTRADEMIYKEANILFPNCAFNFTDEEWFGIYRDSKDYAECFGVENGVWEDAEKAQDVKMSSISQDEIVMAGGHMTVEQLTAMLNTIPLEISFVDTDNINRFFNEGPKVFKRPGMAIDREVFSCHPPKIEQQVRRIIEEFRAGTLDKVPVWMDKNGRTMLVTYMAVRDKSGKYLGTMELVQDMEFAKEYFQK